MTGSGRAVEPALAVAYARFSTTQQSSVEDQHRVNERLAAAAGVRVVGRFQDEALSRSLAEREGVQALFDFVREHREVQYIVVNELERITGDLRQRVALSDLCQELELTLVTEDGPVDPFDEAHQQGADESAVGASKEVRKLRRRTRRSMQSKVESGVVMMRPAFGTRMKPVLGPDGSPLPEGVRRLDAGKPVRSGELELHPDELPWVTRMFEWVANEGCSIDAVARRLTSAQVPTKSGRLQWSRSSVRGILTNPFYRGELVWGRQKVVHTAKGTRLVTRNDDDPDRVVLTSPLGALIDPDLWQRANDVLARRAGARPHTKRRVNPSRAFDGLVYCGRCGHKMYGRRDGKPRKDGSKSDVWRYYCISTRPGYGQVDGFGPPCRRSNAVAESRIIDELARLAADPDQSTLLVTHVPPHEAQEERKAAQQQLRDLKNRWERTVELGLSGVLTVAEMQRHRVQHDEAVAVAQARLARLERPATEPRFSVEAADALVGVCELLRQRQLPADVLRAGLLDMGLVRVLADAPAVQLEWAAL